jgi:hypothetical protein
MQRWGVTLGLAAMALLACSKAGEPPPTLSSASAPAASMAAGAPFAPMAPSAAPAAETDDVAPRERKIVRNADLGIVADDPGEAERSATGIALDLGGHVARSDRSEVESFHGNHARTLVVGMELKIPSERFALAVERLAKLGSRITEQRVYTNDVTDAFMDVEARLVAERALEAQFLQILKQAHSVKDALEVSRSLADVRASIEKLEGQRRLLESQTSMSTIKLSIVREAPPPKVGRFAFADSVARAAGDFLDVSAAIVHGSIRALGAAAPVALFVVLPFALVARALVRRRRKVTPILHEST